MKKLGFGVIGTGSRSGSLVRTLMNDEKQRGDIVALCDIRKSALESYEQRVIKGLGHGTKHYTDYQEMLRDPDVDCVIISTPDYLHHNMAVDAFHAGKHVFCEKPIGVNLTQMIDILTAAKESGKILEVGYVLRYSPFYYKMKELIDEGKIGRPMFVQALEEYYGAYHFNRGWWRKKANTGGIMVQKICHDTDLFCWMFGKPKRVSAFTSINEFKPGNWDSDGETTWNEPGSPLASNPVVIQNGHTVTLDSAASCAELTIDAGGTLTDATNNVGLTVSGNLSNSGTFTCGTSSVTLNGTNQALTGSWTFWSFIKSVSTADTLTFDNTGTYTFGGNVTLNGASGQLLSLVSDSAGDAFDFVMSSGAVKTSLTYLSVKDSDASSSDASQKPIAPTNSTDVSGNTDWFSGTPAVVKRSTIATYYY